jgi:hypothetical protein
MPATRTTSIATAVVVIVLAAGCGGPDSGSRGTTVTASTPTLPSATPTPPPAESVAGLPAAQIAEEARAAARAPNSVRVKGTMTDGGEQLLLDLRLTRAGGHGSVSVDGAAIAIIVIGRTAYLRMSDAFWRKQSGSKAETEALIQLIGGRWIKTALTSKDLGGTAAFASKTRFFDELFNEPGALRKTAPRTVDGIACIGVRSSDGTLWVDASTARPVRLEAPTKSGTGKAITFTEYDKVEPPKAPPAAQIIDGKALGM